MCGHSNILYTPLSYYIVRDLKYIRDGCVSYTIFLCWGGGWFRVWVCVRVSVSVRGWWVVAW